MPRISLAGFKDPVRRPRYIIWTGVIVLVLAAVVIVALGVTSTRWFCSEGCHKVQDDTIVAYQHSSHSNVSCMSCHMPVGANPIIFVLHKAEALGELAMTLSNSYELPLNGVSEVSLKMKPSQCTQCHNLANRVVTPSAGIRIDHKAHSDVNASCPVCHNRIAHKEDFDLVLKNPKDGELNKKHADFMKMTACFRCHSLAQGAAAPGTCSACHPANFQLKPPSHLQAGFFPKKHAELAKEFRAEADKGAEEAKAERKAAGLPETVNVAEAISAAKTAGPADKSIGEEIPKVEEVFYCTTCHQDTFCSNCHGLPMPHPTEFKEPTKAGDPNGHPAFAATKMDKCVMCHGKNDQTHFCDSCHHGKSVKWTYDAAKPWQVQHASAVKTTGVKACTTRCHQAQFCYDCHTKTKAFPSSHKQSGWAKPLVPTVTVYGKTPAKPSALHALDAQKSMDACEVCHGAGGTEAAFCKGCHKITMPHPAEFKKLHVSGKNTPTVCANCHTWTELCSNCHHAGASFTTPWINVHGPQVAQSGAAGCLEKCHKQQDCVNCHTSRKVIPASHKTPTFVRDFANKAQHTQLYLKDPTLCTYCHTGAAKDLPKSAFCMGCHKLDMPHAINSGDKQKFMHKDLFEAKKVTKDVCLNCHQQQFCDNCHHEGSVPDKPWLRQHPNIVRAKGAQSCFACHKDPIFCANCHVNLAKKGLIPPQ